MPERKKTFNEHINSINELVKLKLWFIRYWLKKDKEEDFFFVIRERVDILRKTDIYSRGEDWRKEPNFNDPRWLFLEKKIRDVYERTMNDPDSSPFEQEAFEILQPFFEGFYEWSFNRDLSGFQCGCLRYDSPREDFPARVIIHVANTRCPRSIFDEPAYISQCLLDLIKKSIAEYGADSLYLGSWICGHPRWVKLFPKEWMDNMSPADRDVKRHAGFWGQFTNARGMFNAKYGRILRETGEFPYWNRSSWCTFKALKEHLFHGEGRKV